MKRLNIILFALLGMFLATSCTDEKDPKITSYLPPALSSLPLPAYVFDKDKASLPFNTFRFTKASFDVSVSIMNRLQVAVDGDNFKNAKEIAASAENSIAVTFDDVNKQLLKLNLEPYKAAKVEIRILSTIGESTYGAPSNVLKVTITPYPGGAAKMYTPGNHQGWKPELSQPIYSVKNDGIFTGYLQLDGEFKFASKPSWDGPNYGGGATAGTLDTGGGNLTTAAGYYFATVDTKALTYVLKPMAWGIIGSATPTGWDSDTKMVYDPATKTLKLDLTLVDGEIKFRANSAWDDNLGVPTKGGSITDGLKPGGENIPVKAGNYTITLDLTTPDYKATMIKK